MATRYLRVYVSAGIAKMVNRVRKQTHAVGQKHDGKLNGCGGE